jgi:polyisoprenyl-phosphate glycosyltransferase
VDDFPAAPAPPHTISVVIPVYQGATTLPGLIAEIAPFFAATTTQDGHSFVVNEVILVHDHGPDTSAATIRALAAEFDQVRPVWLSRNFGQHPATLAGMASTGGDWIVTLDEDGQHDPGYIPAFLDTAMAEQATLVYSAPQNAAPHGRLRNAASTISKTAVVKLLGTDVSGFQSFRLVLGSVGRSVGAYAGAGVFLDVAMGWVNPSTAFCPVILREEGGRPSGYSPRRLLSHFWRMVLSSGTRGLRAVSLLGAFFALGGVLLAAYIVISRLAGRVDQAGWSSLMVVTLLTAGAVLFALGIIAEYIGIAVNAAIGRPLYLVADDPAHGPLGRPRSGRA